MTNLASAIIIGAGPSGLALAASLKARGMHYRLLDRKGVAGGAYNDIYADMRLASPAKYLSLPGYALQYDQEYICAREFRDYLRRYAAYHELQIEKALVTQLTPLKPEAGYSLHCQLDGESQAMALYTSGHVILASGMFDTPYYDAALSQMLADTQGPRLVHAHDWQGVEEFRNQSLLIVGDSTSAVEIAEAFAEIGQTVRVSSRKGRFNSIPQRVLGRDVHDLLVPLAKLPTWMLRRHCRHYYENNADPVAEPATHHGLRQFLRNGAIQLVSEISAIEGKTLTFTNGDSADIDVIISATGYRFDYAYVHCGESQQALTDGFDKGESRRWPGLYIMGKSCVFGRPSQFVWGIAHDAPLLAEKIMRKLSRKNNA